PARPRTSRASPDEARGVRGRAKPAVRCRWSACDASTELIACQITQVAPVPGGPTRLAKRRRLHPQMPRYLKHENTVDVKTPPTARVATCQLRDEGPQSATCVSAPDRGRRSPPARIAPFGAVGQGQSWAVTVRHRRAAAGPQRSPKRQCSIAFMGIES